MAAENSFVLDSFALIGYFENEPFADHIQHILFRAGRRNDIPFEDWMKLDLKYIDNWRLKLDFYIFFKTTWVMLTGRGSIHSNPCSNAISPLTPIAGNGRWNRRRYTIRMFGF